MASPGSIVIQAVVDSAKATRDAAKLAMSLGKVDTEADTLDSSLRDAQRAMDRTGDASRDTANDLGHTGDEFDRLAQDAKAMADELRRSSNDMVTSIRGANNDIDQETTGLRQSMGEAGSEAGAEFIGNIAEGIGSGQANVNDVLQGTLGGLVNLAASLGGPIALAAGAAAAGIGTLFAKINADSEAAKARVEGLAGALEELGTTSGQAAQKAIWDEWLATMQQSPDELARIVDGLRAAGIESDTWKEAITGNLSAQQEIKSKLTDIGGQIAANVKAGKPLTEEQQTYLENQSRIHEQLGNMNADLKTVDERQSDINWLTAKTAGDAGKWAENVKGARTEAQRMNDVLDALDGKDVRVDFVANYTGKESDWNPAARAAGQSASPAVGVRAAPVNVTINMQGAFNDPLGNARHIKALLEQGDLRQGRERGAPLAVAWG